MMKVQACADMSAVRGLLPMLKRNLRITGDDNDAVLVEKLLAAVTNAGHYIGGFCVPTIVTVTGKVSSTSITLRGPVISLTSVVVDGVAVEGCTLDGNVLTLPSGSEGKTVAVEYRAGYCPAPPDMVAAIVLIASSLYTGPLDTVEVLPKASSNLLRNYRWLNGEGQ